MKIKSIAAKAWIFIVFLLIGSYIIFSFDNRYQFDDLGLHALVRSSGVWGAFEYMFFNWETPYLSLLLYGLIKWVPVVPPYLFNLIILSVNIFSVFLFLKTLFKNYTIDIDKNISLLLAATIVAVSYFSCRALGNVVYFVTGQIVYCLYLSFLFFGLNFWIRKEVVFSSFFMFLFAHSRINYDAIFLGLYASYFIFLWIKQRKIVIVWKEQIPFLFFLAGLVTYILVPGNYKRTPYFELNNPNQHFTFLVMLKGWASGFFHLAGLILHNWKQLLIIPLGLILGFYFSDNKTVRKYLTLQLLIQCSVAFAIAYIAQITVLLIVIKTPIGYERIFYFLEVLLFTLFLLIGAYLGFLLANRISLKLLGPFIFMLSSCISVMIGLYFYKNYRITSQFAKAYDDRIVNLLRLKKNGIKQDVFLPSVPLSGVLRFTEISPKPADLGKVPDNNIAYIQYYKLPFNVYIIK